MYLTDHEIWALLPQLDFHAPHPDFQFSGEEQIQPASVDLRVSNVFWRPSRRRRLRRYLTVRREHALDLQRPQLRALDPLRDWKRVELQPGDTVTLRPGQVVMGRIYERFRVPPSCAGKIEGRSSYARLGLAIHLTGDFINPGWEGYMPLQLFNAAPYPLRLTPYLPICQLMLVPLAAEPERTYGAPELQSKYVNDDGGPSLWWRDGNVRRLQQRLRTTDAAERVEQEIVDLVRFESPDVLERLQGFVGGRRVRAIENAHELLDTFAAREDWRRRRDVFLIGCPAVTCGALLSGVFVSFSWLHLIFLVLAAISVVAALGAVVRRDSGYLGEREVRAARQHPKGGSS